MLLAQLDADDPFVVLGPAMVNENATGAVVEMTQVAAQATAPPTLIEVNTAALQAHAFQLWETEIMDEVSRRENLLFMPLRSDAAHEMSAEELDQILSPENEQPIARADAVVTAATVSSNPLLAYQAPTQPPNGRDSLWSDPFSDSSSLDSAL
jgi:hypothetical protein